MVVTIILVVGMVMVAIMVLLVLVVVLIILNMILIIGKVLGMVVGLKAWVGLLRIHIFMGISLEAILMSILIGGIMMNLWNILIGMEIMVDIIPVILEMVTTMDMVTMAKGI